MLIWRNLLFIGFVIFVAPFEYHAHWVAHFAKNGQPLWEALHLPLVHGALFFYSIIILVEAVVRIEQHPTLAGVWQSQTLKGLAWFACLPFIIFLLAGQDAQLDGWWLVTQWWTALFSVVISIFTHWFFSKHEIALGD